MADEAQRRAIRVEGLWFVVAGLNILAWGALAVAVTLYADRPVDARPALSEGKPGLEIANSVGDLGLGWVAPGGTWTEITLSVVWLAVVAAVGAVVTALSVNIARRHLSTGARAIVAAKAARLNGVSKSGQSKVTEVPRQRIEDAATILDWAPDCADAVVAGAMPLSKAVEEARGRTVRSTTGRAARCRGPPRFEVDRPTSARRRHRPVHPSIPSTFDPRFPECARRHSHSPEQGQRRRARPSTTSTAPTTRACSAHHNK